MSRMLKLFVAAVYFVAAAHSKSRYGRDTASDEAGHEEPGSTCGGPTQGNHQNRVQSLEDRLAVLESRLIQDLQGHNPARPGNPGNPDDPRPASAARPLTDNPAGPDNLQTNLDTPFDRIISNLDVTWHTELERSTRVERQGNFGYGVYGYPCLNACDNYGETYTYCEQAYASIGNWFYYDYCSKTPEITQKGETCTSDCWRCSRTSYWWCYYDNSSWNYCSPDTVSKQQLSGQTLGIQDLPVPTFAVASARDEQADSVGEEGLLADKEARDQLEILQLEELLEYQKTLNQALEERINILKNGVIGEEKLDNLKTIITVAQVASVGKDGEPAPSAIISS